jgi:hypothetical protein
MVAKGWLQERWEMLMPILAELTLDQEDEIKRVCEEEIAYWRSRETMQSPSSLNKPMTDTRNKIRATFVDLTEKNSYVNPKTGKREHISLKYMNFSPEEWRVISAPSAAKQRRRMQMQRTIADPDAVVAKAVELASSPYWQDRAVAIAVLMGRRLSEVLGPKTDITPKKLYSVSFAGQLKRKDKILLPYEVPTLGEAALVLDAWRFVRDQIEWRGMEPDEINDRYGSQVVEAANRHFEHLVPPREDGDLYTHLFRAVYGCIAIFYYCPDWVHELTYLNTILGHYWVDENGVEQRDYAATLHYDDYRVSDEAVFKYKGKRRGVRLGDPGVEILEVFKDRPVAHSASKGKKGKRMTLLPTDKPKDHSIIRVNPPTEGRVIHIHNEEQHPGFDATVALLVDEHYVLKQMAALLSPLYERLGVNSPLGAVKALLGDGSAFMLDQMLADRWKTSLAEIVSLLEDAAADAGKKDEAPVAYLRGLVTAKRAFRQSYEKRHKDKDYSRLSTSELRRTKTPGAAQERFKRAVDTIIKHNETVQIPEFRRFVSPALVVDLVGGRPSEAKEYIESRADVAEHHQQYGIKPGINRIPLVSVKLEVPEWPEGVEPTEPVESEESPGGEGQEAAEEE